MEGPRHAWTLGLAEVGEVRGQLSHFLPQWPVSGRKLPPELQVRVYVWAFLDLPGIASRWVRFQSSKGVKWGMMSFLKFPEVPGAGLGAFLLSAEKMESANMEWATSIQSGAMITAAEVCGSPCALWTSSAGLYLFYICV